MNEKTNNNPTSLTGNQIKTGYNVNPETISALGEAAGVKAPILGDNQPMEMLARGTTRGPKTTYEITQEQLAAFQHGVEPSADTTPPAETNHQ